MSKLSKILIILGTILIIGFVIFILVKYTSRQTPPQTPPTPGAISEFPIPSPSNEKMPVKTTSGSTIDLNNVYRQSIENLSQNGVAFKENTDYYMAYYPQNQNFIITLLNPDIKTARNKAESDLLETLGIDKNTACQINVSITVPYNVNAEASGQEYGLSFCPNGKPFTK